MVRDITLCPSRRIELLDAPEQFTDVLKQHMDLVPAMELNIPANQLNKIIYGAVLDGDAAVSTIYLMFPYLYGIIYIKRKSRAFPYPLSS